jgi:hypothetical protein
VLSVSEVSNGLWDEGDYRLEHVRDQELSGLSAAEYCRRHDLRPATFYGWRRLRRKFGPGRIAATAVGFTEVFQVGASPFPPASGAARVADVSVALGVSWAAEVALPSGAVVRVGAGADARLLRVVFEALG